MEITLRRLIKTRASVVGVLEGLKAQLYTLEDSWKNNGVGISCIPSGSYICKPHGWERNASVRFPRVWEVTGVIGRTAILIHVGNTHHDTRGCILVGYGLNITNGEASITKSRDAIDFMQQHIGPNRFTLRVLDAE